MLEVTDEEGVKIIEMETLKQLKRPRFRKSSELSFEQLKDPDFRLKQLEKLTRSKLPITCSKCHHCRR